MRVKFSIMYVTSVVNKPTPKENHPEKQSKNRLCTIIFCFVGNKMSGLEFKEPKFVASIWIVTQKGHSTCVPKCNGDGDGDGDGAGDLKLYIVGTLWDLTDKRYNNNKKTTTRGRFTKGFKGLYRNSKWASVSGCVWLVCIWILTAELQWNHWNLSGCRGAHGNSGIDINAFHGWTLTGFPWVRFYFNRKLAFPTHMYAHQMCW